MAAAVLLIEGLGFAGKTCVQLSLLPRFGRSSGELVEDDGEVEDVVEEVEELRVVWGLAMTVECKFNINNELFWASKCD